MKTKAEIQSEIGYKTCIFLMVVNKDSLTELNQEESEILNDLTHHLEVELENALLETLH